jgi:hypothetical protein
VDLETMVMGEDYIIEAQTGVENPEFDLPTLYIRRIHPEPSGA